MPNPLLPTVRRAAWSALCLSCACVAVTRGETSTAPRAATTVPDPAQVGNEPESIVQVANLVYASTKSSQCYSDHFLVQAEQESAISTDRRFHAVKLSSDEMYSFPLAIMTGEGEFTLPDQE